MSDRNWDAELAKIDKQLSSISDEQLLADQRAALAPAAGSAKALPGKPMAPAATAKPSAAAGTVAGTVAGATPRPAAGPWASWLKVSVAVAAAAGLMFWPWPAQCGLPLVGFTAATGAVTLLGVWSAAGTWRHRLGLAHLASLLVVGWGLALGARETLPRIGYAIPTAERAAGWSCEGLPPLTAPPASTPLPAGQSPSAAPPAATPPTVTPGTP
ncbi:MAG TPA: hypothetical protein VE869_03430 [Gemmatimonas sp.]|nr:hypothetical protein [Gemmatimonas sp.]